MLPWGTPEITGRQSDRWFSTETHWDLLLKWLLNQFHRVPVIPMFHNLTNNSLCGTLSKAFLKSM